MTGAVNSYRPAWGGYFQNSLVEVNLGFEAMVTSVRMTYEKPLQFLSGFLLFGALAVSLWGCATPEEVIGRDWVAPWVDPARKDYTPEYISRRRADGWVVLRCISGEGFLPTDCDVIAESPRNVGLGAAALKLTDNMRPATPANGVGPTLHQGEVLNIPVFFCQYAPNTKACRQQHVESGAFLASVAVVENLTKARGCEDARAAALATGQPGYSAYVDRTCVAHDQTEAGKKAP